jgi:hypothetical protein
MRVCVDSGAVQAARGTDTKNTTGPERPARLDTCATRSLAVRLVR